MRGQRAGGYQLKGRRQTVAWFVTNIMFVSTKIRGNDVFTLSFYNAHYNTLSHLR